MNFCYVIWYDRAFSNINTDLISCMLNNKFIIMMEKGEGKNVIIQR